MITLTVFSTICIHEAYSLTCASNEPHKLQFNIKFDRWADETSWRIHRILDNQVYLSGNGTAADDYAESEQQMCVPRGCYELEINDTYGDGIYSYGYFGWFTLKLDDVFVTLGEQTFDGENTYLYFCTDLFDSTSGLQIELNFETYDYNSQIYIVNGDTSNLVPLYANQYEFPDYFNSSVSNTLYLKSPDASIAHCYKIIMDDGYVDTNAGYYIIDAQFDDTELYYYQQNQASVEDLGFNLCQNNSFTTAPTPKPTPGTPDIVFNVGENGKYKSLGYLGCPISSYSYSSSCSDTKTWKIEGNCSNPQLTLNIFVTDYDWNTEQAYIYLNNEYFANCQPLNDECIYQWQTCNMTNKLDINNFLIPIKLSNDPAYTLEVCHARK